MNTNRELAQRLIDCFNAKDVAGLDQILSDTVKHTALGTQFEANVEGRSAYIAYMGGEVLPRFKSLNFQAERILEDPDAGTVILEWRGSFVTSAEKPYSSRGVFVIECRNGRIDWVRDYFDTEKTRQAMS
jgi:ketosteroid isomerase-like protein